MGFGGGLMLRLLGIKVSSLVSTQASTITSFFKEQVEESAEENEAFRCPICNQIIAAAAKTGDNLKLNEHIVSRITKNSIVIFFRMFV